MHPAPPAGLHDAASRPCAAATRTATGSSSPSVGTRTSEPTRVRVRSHHAVSAVNGERSSSSGAAAVAAAALLASFASCSSNDDAGSPPSDGDSGLGSDTVSPPLDTGAPADSGSGTGDAADGGDSGVDYCALAAANPFHEPDGGA